MNREHSFIVVGCGTLGSATAYWLSRMAAPYASVLALERHALGHPPGSRTGTVGHAPDRDAHAALAPAVAGSWRQVECLSGQTLVLRTGGLVIEDDRAGGAVDRLLAVATRHGIAAEELDASGLAARWPQFRPDGAERAVHTPGSGIVDVRRADATHVALARGHGAEVREHEPVRAVHDAGRHVEVVTDHDVYRAEHVVVAAGTGTGDVLGGLADALGLTVVRQQTTWFATPNLIDFSPARFPVFTWHGARTFHGFPVHGEVATALGQQADGADPALSERFLAQRLPGFGGRELGTATVESAAPPDGDVVLDTLPSSPRVSVAIGAGRSAGPASLFGRILAELATTGATRRPISGFAIGRPALAGRPDVREPVPLRSRPWT